MFGRSHLTLIDIIIVVLASVFCLKMNLTHFIYTTPSVFKVLHVAEISHILRKYL